jgi:hypothetical protein
VAVNDQRGRHRNGLLRFSDGKVLRQSYHDFRDNQVKPDTYVLKREPMEDFYSVPIRRTRWPSLFIAFAAFVVSALLAAALSGLLVLSSIKVDGTWVVIVFGLLWGSSFFLSVPRQRRCARALDLRRPGICLADGVLAVPLSDDTMVRFILDEPHELKFGWSEAVVTTVAAPTTHTRSVMTYATLSQAGQHLFLKAEESVRAAQIAGWQKSEGLPQSKIAVRLWANDLVALVEAMRSRSQ